MLTLISNRNSALLYFWCFDLYSIFSLRFQFKCKIGQKVYGFGVASTKKDAKQLAAKLAFDKISKEISMVCAAYFLYFKIPSEVD